MKRLFKVFYIFLIVLIVLGSGVNAETNTSEIEKIISKYKNIDINNITTEEVEEIYNEVLDNYTSEDLSNMVKENKETLKRKGINEKTIEKGAEFLKTTDDKAIKEILKETDVKGVINKIQSGESIESAVLNSQKDLNNTARLGLKLFFSSYIVKTIITIWIIYILYKLIVRGIIYQKAGKMFITTLIPIYRDAILFKICGYSPWIILWLLLPIIGWIIYFIYKIISKFELAEKFGHNAWFGLGLWILNPIFESIIAFSKNEYEKELM